MTSFSVRVINVNQKPIEGIRVMLEFATLIRAKRRNEFTNSEGYAYFNGYEDGEVLIFIMGTIYGKYHYLNGESITVILSNGKSYTSQ